MGKIIFYEDRSFQGRSYETSNDCSELTSYLSKCNSCRVESGLFVVYEKPNFMGQQTLVRRGEYPDNQRLMGTSVSDCIRSSRTVPMSVAWKLRLYERPDFGGQMVERSDDCPSVYDTYKLREAYSCAVADGAWVFYDLPNYRGHQYLLERGEYRQHADWGAASPGVGSFRRITEF
ncbi:gamma-crystallin M2-like isoform X3 [Cyclopterus lumpus]|uniref:gamma-crystallin M2-like isoform X3 n=1 Tax=Cyclopterus lumpus TaxID=8103 RepID=UPI001485EC86|nr:gamma-crystallin M2-like isoform X3 [Cyclopterus lumpus]